MKENIFYIVGLLVFGLLIYIAWSIGIFWFYLQKSKDLITTTKPFQADGSGLRVLVAGDSTAVGVGATNPEDSIAGHIHQQLPDSSIENIGRSGLRSQQLISLLQNSPSRETYDLVVLQIGGNDIVHRTTLSDLEGSLAQILKVAKTLSPNVILMTSGNVGGAPILPKPIQPFFHRRTLKVRSLFQHQAQLHGVHYIDFYRRPDDDPFVLNQDTYFAPDYFHPNSVGYELWYQQVGPIIKQLTNSRV